MKTGHLVASLLLLGLQGPARPAFAQVLHLAGELRLSGTATAASAGQLGPDVGTGPCGSQPNTDIGGGVSGALALVVATGSYRYQLGGGAGYFHYYCTPSLSRPVGGLDFHGEHRLSQRTQFMTDLRLTFDSFDRSLDIRTGIVDPARPDLLPAGQLAAGKPYALGTAGLDVEHQFTGHHGLRAGLSLSTMQILDTLDDLSPTSTLGPMETGELHVTPFYDTVRERIEVLGRYQVSHFFAASQRDAQSIDPGTGRVQHLLRWQVPPAQDTSLSAAWERRFSPLWTLHLEGGLGAAYQPNLCLRPGPGPGCSIDRDAPGIRGAAAAPPLEVSLSDLTTGTFVGLISVTYRSRKNVLELQLQRLYEPSFYASSLALTNRLSGNVLWRFSPDLLLTGNVFLSQLGFTSPAQVEDSNQLVSPQNRSLLSAAGTVLLDWNFVGPLALFTQVDGQVYAVRGEAVIGSGGRITAFPGPSGYQTTARVSLTLGIRLFFRPASAREQDLLTTIRPLP